MAATTLSSITYNGVTYSVGDVITINSNWYQDLDDTSPSPNNISAYISQMTFTIETIYNPEANSSWLNPIQVRVKTTPNASIGGTGMIRLSQVASGGKANFTVGTATAKPFDNRNNSYPSTGGWFEGLSIQWSGFSYPSSNPCQAHHIYYRECKDNGSNSPDGNWSGWVGVTGGASASNSGSYNLASVDQTNGNTSSNWGTRDYWYQFVVIGIMADGSNTGWGCTTNYVRKCRSYLQSFNANGGSGAPSGKYKFNSYDFVMPSAPSTAKTGHTFNGWSTSATATSGHAAGARVAHSTVGDKTNTWYATWKPNQYTLTINPNGGTWNSTTSNSTAKQDYGTTKTIANPTRTGYTFGGWTLSGSGSLSGTTYTYGAGAGTLTAKWTVNQYTYNIVYKSSSGTQLGTATAKYNYGTTNSISPKSYTGYTSPAAQSVKWDSTSAKTITFTYTPISYTLSYTLNSGSVRTANKTSYTIETATFTLNNPIREGYKFTGWTGSNGTTASKSVSIAKGSTGNKSYTANWTALSAKEKEVYIYKDGTIEAALFLTSTSKHGFYNTGAVYAKEFVTASSNWGIDSDGKMYFKAFREKSL